MRAVGFGLVAGLCAASSALAVTAPPHEGAPVPSRTAPDSASCAEAPTLRADPEALDMTTGPTLAALPRRHSTPAPTPEMKPTPGDSGDARPTEVSADTQPPAAPARQFRRWGGLVSVGTCGEVSYELTWWNAAYGRDGYDLVAYDLAPLAPTAGDLCESLRGYRQPDVPAAPAPPWWRGLCENIIRAVGTDRWPAPATLLGWEAAAAVLYVRQDADGQRRVEQYLGRLARDRLGTIGLVAHLDARPDVEPLALQVPWGSPVRAHQGSTWLYVQDFDVEVSQESCISEPIVANVDTGFAISAHRIDGRDSSGDLDVEIAFSEDAPAFDRFETALACTPVVVEIPRPRRGYWRGLVSPFPAAYSIPLDDGRAVTLTVLGETETFPSSAASSPESFSMRPPWGGPDLRRSTCTSTGTYPASRSHTTWNSCQGARKGKPRSSRGQPWWNGATRGNRRQWGRAGRAASWPGRSRREGCGSALPRSGWPTSKSWTSSSSVPGPPT